MSDKLKITYTDDGKNKSHSHTARVDFVGFSVADFEAYGDTRAEADSELRTKLMSLRSAVDDLLGSKQLDHVYVVGEAALRGMLMTADANSRLVLSRGDYSASFVGYAAQDLVPDERVVVRGGRIYRHD